ncbi:MAG: response regulator transcription factor [Pseudomonadales bacterium]
MSLLLVEDHMELAETVGAYLESSGYTLDYAADGVNAMHLAVTQSFDAIILDIMLPGINGLEVCRRLRTEARLTTPIIMLTARDELDDKLEGFDVGADDYLVKPFALPELEARIEALVRRHRGLAAVYSVGELEMNVETLEVTRAGASVQLSKTLFGILRILMRESPRFVSRETIEREIWGDDRPDSDTLRSHLYNLRQAVDQPFDYPMVETRSGQGYRVNARQADT